MQADQQCRTSDIVRNSLAISQLQKKTTYGLKAGIHAELTVTQASPQQRSFRLDIHLPGTRFRSGFQYFTEAVTLPFDIAPIGVPGG